VCYRLSQKFLKNVNGSFMGLNRIFEMKGSVEKVLTGENGEGWLIASGKDKCIR
jgi:hypothetical protein